MVIVKRERKYNLRIELMEFVNRLEGKKNNRGWFLDFWFDLLVGWVELFWDVDVCVRNIFEEEK